jgi:DnaJ family protein C protein 13
VTAGLPLVQRSYLGALLPESLLHMLESYGPGVFAAALSGDHNTPEIIWTAGMRQQRLIPAMLQVGSLSLASGLMCMQLMLSCTTYGGSWRQFCRWV